MMFLVIGYGSLLRGDDGIGQLLADQLRERLPILDCITATQLTPELAEIISRARMVFFLDAATDCDPGVITYQQITPEASSGAFSHNVTPQSLLQAAHELYGHRPEAALISVGSTHFDYAAELSSELTSLLPQITSCVQNMIESSIASFNHSENLEKPHA